MVLQRRYSVTGQTPPDDVGAIKAHSPKLQALDTSVQTTSCGLCEGGADVVRTSSKRSATQLPSPSTPSSQELPTKIARLGLEHDDMDDGCLTDPFPEESDWALSSFEGSSSSAPPSPDFSPPTSLPDEAMVDPLDLDGREQPDEIVVEDLALSPSPTTETHVPTTLLTLPPELRHQIYRHLPDLVLPYPLIYCLSTFDNHMQHPLASVSRLIRSEALAIFYSYNTWIIKLEFKMMYEAFQEWIIRLGEGAGALRLVTIAVRGSLFKPKTTHTSTININGQMVQMLGVPGVVPPQQEEQYHPPDGDASFNIDLSEKYPGGRVQLMRNDGTREAGESAKAHLSKLVEGLWEKRRSGTLNGQDWVNVVDNFLEFTGWW